MKDSSFISNKKLFERARAITAAIKKDIHNNCRNYSSSVAETQKASEILSAPPKKK